MQHCRVGCCAEAPSSLSTRGREFGMSLRFASCARLSIFAWLSLNACSSAESPLEGSLSVTKQAVAPVTSCELSADVVSHLVLPAGMDVEDAGTVAYGKLKIGDRARVVSASGAALSVFNVGANGRPGAWSSEIGVSGRVGAIQSVPSVFLRNNAIVQGGIETEGGITTQGGEQVSGPRIEDVRRRREACAGEASCRTHDPSLGFQTSSRGQARASSSKTKLPPLDILARTRMFRSMRAPRSPCRRACIACAHFSSSLNQPFG